MSGLNIGFGMDAIMGNRDVSGRKFNEKQINEEPPEHIFKTISRSKMMRNGNPGTLNADQIISGRSMSELAFNNSFGNLNATLEEALKRILGCGVRTGQMDFFGKSCGTGFPAKVQGEPGKCGSAELTSFMSFDTISFHYEAHHIKFQSAGTFSSQSFSSAFMLELTIVKIKYASFTDFKEAEIPDPFVLECCDSVRDLKHVKFDLTSGGDDYAENAEEKNLGAGTLELSENEDVFIKRSSNLIASSPNHVELDGGRGQEEEKDREGLQELFWKWQGRKR